MSDIESIYIKDNINNKHLPGDFAMWVFIVMELSVFALFFIGFKITERFNIDMFIEGKQSLNLSIGLVCTIALIVSSYWVVLSVKAIQRGDNRRAKWFLVAALLTSCVYLLSKMLEYQHLMAFGFDLSTNTFYTLYFFITGFHYLHVVMGMIILSVMAYRAHKQQYTLTQHNGFEAGASYWHMLDLVWVIVFYLIYLSH